MRLCPAKSQNRSFIETPVVPPYLERKYADIVRRMPDLTNLTSLGKLTSTSHNKACRT